MARLYFICGVCQAGLAAMRDKKLPSTLAERDIYSRRHMRILRGELPSPAPAG